MCERLVCISYQPRLVIFYHFLPLGLGNGHRFIRAVVVTDTNGFAGSANFLAVRGDLHQYMRHIKAAVTYTRGAYIAGNLVI